MKQKRRTQVKCAKCGKRGGVRVRMDAYADHKVFVSKNAKGAIITDVEYDDTAVMDELQAIDCFHCDNSMSKRELENANPGLSL